MWNPKIRYQTIIDEIIRQEGMGDKRKDQWLVTEVSEIVARARQQE